MVIARFQGAYRTGGASRVLAASTGHDTRPMPAVRAWLGLCIAAAGAAGDTGVESRPPSAMVGLGGSGRVAPSGGGYNDGPRRHAALHLLSFSPCSRRHESRRTIPIPETAGRASACRWRVMGWFGQLQIREFRSGG